MTLSQKAYIDTVCAWFRLQDAWPATTPMEAGVQLTDTRRNEHHANFPYKEIIGLLMHVAMATQPNIAFVTSILVQYSQDPTRAHWEVAKRVVHNLKITHNLKLTYGSINA